VGVILAHSGSHLLGFLVGAVVVLIAVAIRDQFRKRQPDSDDQADEEEVGRM
jgi:hypothetical protein